jgi:hypothetical protein
MMPTEPTAEEVDAIAEALAAGRKIEAIKIYRQATGQGLKEAKEFVDVLSAKLKERDPDKYAKLSSGGCASMLVFLLVLTMGAVGWAVHGG